MLLIGFPIRSAITRGTLWPGVSLLLNVLSDCEVSLVSAVVHIHRKLTRRSIRIWPDELTATAHPLRSEFIMSCICPSGWSSV